MTTLNLSNVQPDFDVILAQLEAELTTTDAWRGLVETQTGQQLLRMLSAIGAFSQAKIRRNFQDAFPETVVSDRAAYSLAQSQGIRLPRKLPAQVTVTLTSAGITQTVPAYSVFQGAGTFFFNRTAIFLTSNVPQVVTLYQGIVHTTSMQGLGQDYSLFVSEEKNFTVSDQDVHVLVNTTELTRATDGMWTLVGVAGFVDRTHPDGALLIEFGNADYGKVPGVNETVTITYCTTAGSSGNSLNTVNKVVHATGLTGVTGTITSQATGGSDEKSPLLFKNIAAPTFGAFGSAVTRPQYLTTASNYSGIVDVITFSQREVNPYSLEWMNLIKIVPLTSSVWSTGQKNDYLSYMQDHGMFAPRFFWEDPTPVPINVTVNIYCYNWSNSTTVKANVQTAIQTFLAPKAGILNFDVYMSDLISVVQAADPGVEYCQLINPTSDTILSGKPADAPVLLSPVGPGSLVAGVYYYAISFTTAAGVITTKNFANITTTSTAGIQVSWTAIPDATGYKVYGRNAAGIGLLATLGSGVTTWNDDGSVAIGAAPPTQNTVPVRYPQLGTLTVVDHYSTRALRN